MGGGNNGHDFCRTKFIPSLATVNYKFDVADAPDGDRTNLVKLWNEDLSGHAALRIPVPADSQMDLQTFFFGPMTHSLTLRPRRPKTGCCSCTAPFEFDLASDLFSPAFATGEIANSMCACSNEVTVNLPTGQLKGNISDACCTFQPRKNLEWSTGDNMSYRLPPCIMCCGPWRTGYVGTGPGEEENHQIRYWDHTGLFVECSCQALLLTCCAPFKECCFELKHCVKQCCETEWHFTSWKMWSLLEMRALLLRHYSFVLRSAFGEPTYSLVGDDIEIEFRHPAYYSDINALGNWRVSAHKGGCCKIMMTESSDVPQELAKATAFDLSFRGTFNQNILDPRDFNLALGYLVLTYFFYVSAQQKSDKVGVAHGLPGWFYRALMTPRQAPSAVGYAPPMPPMMGMPPPPPKSEDFL